MSTDIQTFLDRGGEIKVIPPSTKQAKPTKWKKFTRQELDQILHTLKNLGSSDTLVLCRILNMSLSKVNSALAVAENHGKVKSKFINKVKIWECIQ